MKYLFIIIFITANFNSCKCENKSYANKQIEGLKKTLKNFQKINSNEWVYFPCDSCVNRGKKSKLILYLRKDLLLTRDLTEEENNENELLKEILQEALIKY